MISTNELKFLLNQVSDALLYESIDRKVLLVNQQFCDLFSIPAHPDDLVGFDCAAAATMSAQMFKNAAQFLNRITEILEAKKAVSDDWIELINGSFFLRDYMPIETNGIKTGHLWIYKNRTKEVELSQINNSQDEFYKNILDNIPADIALFNLKHQYLFANRNAIANEEIRKWIVGKDDFDYVKMKNLPTQQATKRRIIFNDALSSGITMEFEDVSFTPVGKSVHNLRKFFPHKNENGEIDYVVGYGVNIDTIKEKQTLLERSEIKYKNLLYHLNEIVITLDSNNNISFVNPVWETIMGYKSDETLGAPLESFFGKKIATSINDMAFQFRKTKTAQTKPQLFNLYNLHAQEKYLLFTVSINQSASLEEEQVMIFISDVTEQKIATNQLQKMIDKEVELNEVKKSLLNMVSHELRTPLAIIQAIVELLEVTSKKKKPVLQELEEDFNSIRIEIRRMIEIMDALIILSRTENEKTKFKPSLIKPNVFITKEIARKFQPWSDGRNLIISNKASEKKVLIDVFATSRILDNLLENAFKYSFSPAKVIIQVKSHASYWSVLIIDNGIGIPEKDKTSLFSSFKRGGNAYNIPGTGMGLVIVQYFLKSIQGTIHIKSTENKGTAVYLTFPNEA
jgi:PAS domain S-box-containing protein